MGEADASAAAPVGPAAARQAAAPGRRQLLLVFAGLMLAVLLAALDQTIVATALPTIVGELHGLEHMAWAVTAYLLAATIGLTVREADFGGADIFRVHEFPGWVFCTESVRRLVEKEGFSNVAFLEMGDTISTVDSRNYSGLYCCR